MKKAGGGRELSTATMKGREGRAAEWWKPSFDREEKGFGGKFHRCRRGGFFIKKKGSIRSRKEKISATYA